MDGMSGSHSNGTVPAPRAQPANHGRRRLVALAVVLLALPIVLVAAAVLTAEPPRTEATPATFAARTASGPSSTLSIDLGRVLCGDCCVGNLWKAIGNMPGVRDIDAKAGNQKFVVYYDAAKLQPDRVLAAVVAAGDATARLVPVDPSAPAAGTERHWVRPVRR